MARTTLWKARVVEIRALLFQQCENVNWVSSIQALIIKEELKCLYDVKNTQPDISLYLAIERLIGLGVQDISRVFTRYSDVIILIQADQSALLRSGSSE